jgi:peptidyl-prolyl cis-trans isomerase A (cyclophilin A)
MKHIFSFRKRSVGIGLLGLLGLLTCALSWGQTVRLKTTLGDIVLELNAKAAPKTVDNFVTYVNAGHYDGTIFHRVIDGFMIQGGGFTPEMQQKPTRPPIPLESSNGLKNETGTVAMARTMQPNSATSQFFINLKDNAFLNYTDPMANPGYTVFGKVVKGMEVVEKIKLVATATQGNYENVPKTPVVITKATLEK